MRKIIYIVSSLLIFAACSGTIDSDDPGQVPDEYVGPYILSVDKTEVEANGKDYVTFALMDKYDRDILLDRRALQSINIVSEEGQRVPRMENKARFIANGTYNYSVTFQGQKSNVVKIVAKNRGLYEKFHKNVAVYKATATWCPGCPGMTSALARTNQDTQDHLVEMAWHSEDEFDINFGGANDCGKLVAAYLSGGSVAFPTLVYDLIEMYSTAEASSSTIESSIWNIRADYPATCGIKLATNYDSAGRKIKINAELTSATGGEYDLACAILLNNQIVPTGTSDDKKYSHIVCAATPNYLMYSTSIKKVAKDGTLPFEMNVDLQSDYSADDLSVVVFALVKHENGARIDNIVEVELGESVDYHYND